MYTQSCLLEVFSTQIEEESMDEQTDCPVSTVRLCPPTPRGRAFPCHHRKLPAPHPGLCRLGRWAGRYQGPCHPVEGALDFPVPSRHSEHHAGVSQPVLRFPRLVRLPGEDFVHPAAVVPGGQQGTDPGGVRASSFRRPGKRSGALGVALGNHLLHRHPGQ